jgi:hypothetical protein
VVALAGLIFAVRKNSVVGEDLHQNFPCLDKRRWGVLSIGSLSKARNVVTHRLARPKGEMGSQGATRHHLVRQLFGKEGLSLGKDVGDSEAPSLPPVMKLLPGQPLQVPHPKKNTGQASGFDGHSLVKG